MCPQPPANGTVQFHSQVIWPQSTEDILLVKFQSKFQGLNEDLSTSVLLTFGPAILCLYLLEASGTHTFPHHIHTSVDEKNVSSHRPLSPGSKNLPTGPPPPECPGQVAWPLCVLPLSPARQSVWGTGLQGLRNPLGGRQQFCLHAF